MLGHSIVGWSWRPPDTSVTPTRPDPASTTTIPSPERCHSAPWPAADRCTSTTSPPPRPIRSRACAGGRRRRPVGSGAQTLGPSPPQLLVDHDDTVVEMAAWALGEHPPRADDVDALSAVATGHAGVPVPRGGRGRPRCPGASAGPGGDPGRDEGPGHGAPPGRSRPSPPSTGPMSSEPWRRRSTTGTGRSGRRPRTSPGRPPGRAADGRGPGSGPPGPRSYRSS